MALAALGLLAALSVTLSDLPMAGKAPLSTLALAYGLWLARREWRRAACAFEFDGAGQVLICQGANARPVALPRLSLRGVVATLAWRDESGGRQSLAWCADTLPLAARRQLRLRLATGAAA